MVKTKVSVFFSDGASCWKYLREHDPNYGILYKIVNAFTDNKDASAISEFKKANIDINLLDYAAWSSFTDIPDIELKRQSYFRLVGNIISGYKPTVIMLSGFMKIIPSGFLEKFPTINVHPADLRVLGENGKRKYTGKHSVKLAIDSGVKETYSTIHQVTPEVDEGPIITVSNPLAVIPGRSVEDHQEEMKWLCDGPGMARALEMIAKGKYIRQ